MKQDNKVISVLGLGYIGLPTASMFATHGFRVHGVDVNKDIIEILKQGQIHIEEPGLSTVVKAALSSGNLTVDTKPAPADVFIIAVPTPYQHGSSDVPKADISFVKSALESILPLLKKGNLVILESTSPPGTTRDLLIPLLEKNGFHAGNDIGVAYCPERVIPGQALKELIENDRVVGAVTPEWAEETKKLYRAFVGGEIFLTTPTVAEMVKVLENTYRDVNIALANEVSVLCEKLKIDVWEVIDLANRHPRVHVHKPGPGVGGHCISVDPWFLVEMFTQDARLIHLARTINDRRPQLVVDRIESLLKDHPNPKVALLGLSYKGNVDDIRESPAMAVFNLLKKQHTETTVAIADPHVKPNTHPVVPLSEAVKGADLVVILTAHDEFKSLDPQQLAGLMRTKQIFDTHNILKLDPWRAAGFKVTTLGREPAASKT